MSSISRLLLVVLALTLAAGGAHPAQETQPPRARDSVDRSAWQSRPLDELIALLPDVELEHWQDPQAGVFVVHPAVEELRRRMDVGLVLSDEQWLRALIGSGAIRWRSTWPVGEPLAISLRRPGWVDAPRLRVLPRHGVLREVTCGLPVPMCGFSHDLDRERALHSELGSLRRGRHALVVEVVIETRGGQGVCGAPTIHWQGVLPLEVEIVPDLDSVLPPRSDPELHAALRRLVQMERPKDSSRGGRLFLGQDAAAREALAGVALPIQVELWRGHRIIETCPPARRKPTMGPPDLPPEKHKLAWLTSLPLRRQDLTGWTLRLRGVEENALTWWGATTRFDGVIEIPLIELLR